jgi:GNAT superfamily N-acetyltransferase
MADDAELVLRPATADDVDKLAVVLARAFFDDPPLVWLLPNPNARAARLVRMFRAVVGIESLQHGGVEVVAAGKGIAGGAVWLPPGHWRPSASEYLQGAPHYIWALATAWSRVAQYGRALEGARPGEPHWYLKALGVDPTWQGKGVAALLLNSRLERCDAEGQPAFLETTKQRGVAMYERYGFKSIGDIPMPHGAPAQAAMWREPEA